VFCCSGESNKKGAYQVTPPVDRPLQYIRKKDKWKKILKGYVKVVVKNLP